MRWGISDEATNNHMASNICVNEIINSQKASVGPNFVVINISFQFLRFIKLLNIIRIEKKGFLSHRYGSRGLPTTILAEEFKLLKDEMITNPDIDLTFQYESNVFKTQLNDLIDYCYQIDENEIPFKYRLKSISKIVTNFVLKVCALIWIKIY